MFFADPQTQQVRSLPLAWTNLALPDPFLLVAAGKAVLRFSDLQQLTQFRKREADSPKGGITNMVHLEPLEAVLDADRRSRAFAHPDPTQDRFETDAVLIRGPQFDGGFGEGLLQFLHALGEGF